MGATKTKKDRKVSIYDYLIAKKARGEKLSKLAEWMLSEEGKEGIFDIVDMKAVMK
jgi:hypothetical protein